MRKKILSLLTRLGANVWDESAVILSLLFSVVFFRSCSSATDEDTAFPSALQKTKEYFHTIGYSLPFTPDTDSLPLFKEIGNYICNHGFSSIYSSIVNPFAIYPSTDQSIPLDIQFSLSYDVIRHVQKIHNSPTLSFPKHFQAIKSELFPGLTQHDILAFAHSIEIICMDSNVPVLETGYIQDLLTFRKQNIGVSNDMIFYMYMLIYAHGVNSWNKASEDKTIKTYDPLVAKPLFEIVLRVCHNTDPITVIKAILYPPSRNLSGLETSYLYQLIKKQSVSGSCLVIDPSPDLIHKIVSYQFDCSFMFSNTSLMEIYKKAFPYYEKRIYKLMVAWAYMPRYDLVVWCSTGKEWEYAKKAKRAQNHISTSIINTDSPMKTKAEITKTIDKKLEENESYSKSKLQPIFYCRKSSFLMVMTDMQFNLNKNILAEEFKKDGISLNSILLMPTRRLSSVPNNYLILQLTPGSEPETVEILTMLPTEYKDISPTMTKARIIHKHLFINYHTLISSKENIRSLFTQFLRSNTRTRSFVNHHSAQQYKYSDEITVCYRLYKNRKNRPYTAICYYKSVNGNRSEELERSSNTIEGIYDTIEDLVNHELRKQIKSDIKYRLQEGDLKGIIPCIKTLNFYCYESLKTNGDSYSSKLCSEIFSNKHPYISSIHPDSHTEQDEYERIINLEYPKCSNEEQNNILLQIKIILEASKSMGIAVYISPIQELLNILELGKYERAEMREMLKRNHYSDDEELKIAEYIFAKPISDYQKINIMTETVFDILIHYTPASYFELCALTWGDVPYIDIAHIYELNISKKIDTNNKAIYYSDISKPLKSRPVPLAPILIPVIEKYKELLIAINPSACESEQPFLQITSDDHPRTLMGVSKAQAKEFYKTLDNYSGRQDIHNYFDLPGTDIQDDLDQRKGPPMVPSWFHHCTMLGMQDGQSSFTIGIYPDSTDDRHYSGYMSPFLQEKIALIVNRWINSMLISLQTPTLIQGSYRRKAILGPLKISPHTLLEVSGGKYGLKLSVSAMQKSNKKE